MDPHATPVPVRIRRLPHAQGLPLPAYASAGAAGLDVRAALDAPLELEAGAIVHVPTGFALEVPPGFEVQLRPRSGLAARHGVTLANSPATIDSDYRGEVQVVLVNHGPGPMRLERGMRIAQLVLARVPALVWDEVDALSPTVREGGGFGHTGVD